MAERTPSELLVAAADKIEKVVKGTSPGPWFFDSYCRVFSAPKMQPYEDWSDACDDSHTLERHGTCAPCGAKWRDPAPSPGLGHGCKLHTEEYRRDPLVLYAPAHHGDTAIDARAADLAYAAAMNPLVGAALVTLLRGQAAVARMFGDENFGGAGEYALVVARALLGEEQGREAQGQERIEEEERRGE